MTLVVTGIGFLIHIYRRLHEHDERLHALLRVPEPVHRLDADPGARRQPAGDVRRLGRRRPLLVPADRLLVRQGRQRAAPAARRSSSTASATSASCSACSCSSPRPARSSSPSIDAKTSTALQRRAAGSSAHAGRATVTVAHAVPVRGLPPARARRFRSTSGCPTPWPARRRSRRSSTPPPWSPPASTWSCRLHAVFVLAPATIAA